MSATVNSRWPRGSTSASCATGNTSPLCRKPSLTTCREWSEGRPVDRTDCAPIRQSCPRPRENRILGRTLRVVNTKNPLANRGGSKPYVRDLGLGVLERGHRPVAYSTCLGEVAEELRAATVPIID